MSARQVLVGLLQASGAGSFEEADALASLVPPPGGTWTVAALDSGKLDEVRFAEELAKFARAERWWLENVQVERAVLGWYRVGSFSSTTCSRFLPGDKSDPVSRPTTFSTAAARRSGRSSLVAGKRVEWVLCARSPLLADDQDAVRGRGRDAWRNCLQSTRYDNHEEREQAHDLASDDPEASAREVRF